MNHVCVKLRRPAGPPARPPFAARTFLRVHETSGAAPPALLLRRTRLVCLRYSFNESFKMRDIYACFDGTRPVNNARSGTKSAVSLSSQSERTHNGRIAE